MRSVAIVPAAGSSERFEGQKLLADVGGVTLVERTVAALRDGGVDEVVLVVGPLDEQVRRTPGVRVEVNPDPSRGMFSSLQAGLRDVSADALVVIPADMPFVRPATVRSLLQVWDARGGIVSPRYNGKRGHPVVLSYALRQEIVDASPTSTLHHVISAHRGERVDLDVDDPGVTRDVDVREDLASA